MWQKKKLLYICIFLLLALIYAVTGGAHPATAKTSFKKCLECHKDLQKEIKLKGAHAPFKNFNCGSCHNPHASKHKSLVKREIGSLCKSCHKGKGVKQKFSHDPMEKGNCLECHDPHASKDRNLLVAKGKELCFKCHKAESVFPGKIKHEPARKGLCLKCHNPHGSDDFSLLRKNKEKICLSCHSIETTETKKAHKFYPVSGTECVSCHNPHGAKKDDLIKQNKHKPFAKGNCQKCHNSPEAGNPLGLNKKGALVCLQCHKKVDEDFNKINNHFFDGVFCINCHNPHTSDQSGMKKGVLKKICFNCHQDTTWRMSDKKTKFLHPEVKKGNCNSCHDPHGSNFRLLLANNEFAVCTSCHKRHATFSHPVGDSAIDPRSKRDITCITCHALMASKHEFALRLDGKKELCIQCHTSY